MILGGVAAFLSMCGGCNLFSLAALVGAFIMGGMGLKTAAEMGGQGREQSMIAFGLAALAIVFDIGWCFIWSVIGVIAIANG